MASQKTIERKRDQMLARANAFNTIPAVHEGAPRVERRKAIQRWCRKFGVPYKDAREAIREEEAKMRAEGIDPWKVEKTEVSMKGKGMEMTKVTTVLEKVRNFFNEETV